MKKIILCAILLLFVTAGFSQQTIPVTPALTKADYLEKSKKQKTTAWILLGAGSTLVVTSFALAIQDINYGSNIGRNTLILMASAGGAAMLVSIHFFSASSKNKKKALSLSFKNEFAPQIQKSLISHYVPSLNVKLGL